MVERGRCGRIRPHLVAKRHTLDDVLLAVLIHKKLSLCPDETGIAVLYLLFLCRFLTQCCQIHAVGDPVSIQILRTTLRPAQQKRLKFARFSGTSFQRSAGK